MKCVEKMTECVKLGKLLRTAPLYDYYFISPQLLIRPFSRDLSPLYFKVHGFPF